jgi:hypothetical protein
MASPKKTGIDRAKKSEIETRLMNEIPSNAEVVIEKLIYGDGDTYNYVRAYIFSGNYPRWNCLVLNYATPDPLTAAFPRLKDARRWIAAILRKARR